MMKTSCWVCVMDTFLRYGDSAINLSNPPQSLDTTPRDDIGMTRNNKCVSQCARATAHPNFQLHVIYGMTHIRRVREQNVPRKTLTNT